MDAPDQYFAFLADDADFDDPGLEELRHLMTDDDFARVVEGLRSWADGPVLAAKLWAWRRTRVLH